MDTQPRAEDDFLPTHESQPEGHVAADHGEAVADVLATADEALDIDATATDEPDNEAQQDIPPSAEDLQDDLQIEIEAVEVRLESSDRESADLEAEGPVVHAETTEQPVSVELAPEELVLEELTFDEPIPSAEAEAPAPAVEKAAAETPEAVKFVTESEFEQLVDEALEAVGGILLFKMRIDDEGEDKHIAAASFGDGARRQFLLLSLPVAGGKLKVESATRSENPLAKLAEAYVGVVEAFRSAA